MVSLVMLEFSASKHILLYKVILLHESYVTSLELNIRLCVILYASSHNEIPMVITGTWLSTTNTVKRVIWSNQTKVTCTFAYIDIDFVYYLTHHL